MVDIYIAWQWYFIEIRYSQCNYCQIHYHKDTTVLALVADRKTFLNNHFSDHHLLQLLPTVFERAACRVFAAAAHLQSPTDDREVMWNNAKNPCDDTFCFWLTLLFFF